MPEDVLHSERTADGSRSVWLSRTGDGGISIEGQDLGDLSNFFGAGACEYEWGYAVSAEHVSRLTAALGGGSGADVTDLIRARFSGIRHGDFAEFCKEHAVVVSFWSRIGVND